MRLLSVHAVANLRRIAADPVPRVSVDPACAARLLRDGLVERVPLPSPFPRHRGRAIGHLRVTEAGRRVLAPPAVDDPVRAARVALLAELREISESMRRPMMNWHLFNPHKLEGAWRAAIDTFARENGLEAAGAE